MHVGAGIPNIQRIHTDQQQEQDRAAVTVEPGVCGQAEQHWQLPQVHGHQVGPSLLLPLCVCLMSQTKMDLVGPAAPAASAAAAAAASAAATAAASAAAASAATAAAATAAAAAAAAAAAVTSRRLMKGVLLHSNSISTSVLFNNFLSLGHQLNHHHIHAFAHEEERGAKCLPRVTPRTMQSPAFLKTTSGTAPQPLCTLNLHSNIMQYSLYCSM